MTVNENNRFHIPEDIRFTCKNSGVCCTVFKNIPVDKNVEEKIRHIGEQKLLDAVSGGTGVDNVLTSVNGDLQIARTKCGDCSMLGTDHLCTIHKVAGSDSKPQVCRDFPYRYAETPGGVFVGLSFVCPTVRENAGELLFEQSDSIEKHYESSKSKPHYPNDIFLNRRYHLTWDEYADLEKSFYEILNKKDVPINVGVISCCVIINLVNQFIDDLNKESGLPPEGFLPVGKLNEFLEVLRRDNYQTIIRIAIKPRKGLATARRMFLGMFVSFANTLQKSGGRVHTVVNVMLNYIRHAGGIGRLKFQPLDVLVSYDELATAGDCFTGDDELLKRYIIHCIWRKDLITEGNVARRLRFLALNLALVSWYAKASSKKRGSKAVELHDVSEGIATVERLFGFHSAFFKFFEKNRTFDDIVESFLLKPNYPFIVLQKKYDN